MTLSLWTQLVPNFFFHKSSAQSLEWPSVPRAYNEKTSSSTRITCQLLSSQSWRRSSATVFLFHNSLNVFHHCFNQHLMPGRNRICPNITRCKRRWFTSNCYNIAKWRATCSGHETAKVHRNPNNASGWRVLIVIAAIAKIWYVFPSSLRTPQMSTRTSWFGNNRGNYISTTMHRINVTAFGNRRFL